MKRLSVPPLAVVCLAVIACMAGQAGASDWGNPTDYGYGGGYTSGAANFAPEMSGYGGPAPASYPQYGYAAYNYPGYSAGGYAGYAGYGYGGYGGGQHCCSFGGNCGCCASCWDGYSACRSCGVKVHRRHRALGCGAGPCVDGSCGSIAYGYANNCGRQHRCFLRRNRAQAYCGAGGCSDCGGGTMIDAAPMQPGMSGPTPTEQLQSPPPSPNIEPPSPGDDSST